MKFVDMKLDARESKAEVACPEPSEGPAYPYGLCLYLDGDSLAKLGMKTEDFPVGQEVAMMGMAKVVGISVRQREGGEDYSSVDLQITELGIGAGDELEEEKAEASAPKSVGARLYGGK